MKRLSAILLLLSCALHAAEPPAPTSMEMAEAQLARATSLRSEAAAERKTIESQKEKAYADCARGFLVNHCKDQARGVYIQQINKARAKEIEANALVRVAKTYQLQQRETEMQRQATSSAPASDASSPAGAHPAKTPTAKPLSTPAPLKPAPSPTPAPASQTAADALKQQKAANAAARQQSATAEAAARAQKARDDAARYAKRLQEHAAKAAQRKKPAEQTLPPLEEQGASKGKTAPATSTSVPPPPPPPGI